MSVFFNMKPEVVDYDLNWPILYNNEKEILCNIFGDLVEGIEHFGSTSVPGLCAKPIIDIQIACKYLPLNDEIINKLKNIGYIHRVIESVDISEYIRFDKGNPKVTHCLHCRKGKSDGWYTAIKSREYMRSHLEETMNIYGKTKKEILSDPSVTMEQYRQRKQEVVAIIVDKAEKWWLETNQSF